MGIDNDKLIDLIRTTLKDLPKGQFEVMWDSQDFEFANIYEQSRRQVDGGTSIMRNVILDRTGTAKYRQLYDTDDLAVDNVQKQIEVPWTQLGTNYSWDVVEVLRNRNSAKGFIRLIEGRRTERLWDLAELIEERGWLTPADSSDKKHPYGVPYYLPMLDAGSTTGGFYGKTIRYQDATTTTSCAGIDAAVEPKWRSYADTYSKVDNKLLRTLRKAFLLTRFKPPRNVRAPGNDARGAVAKLYCNSDVAVELMDLADKRDDASTPADLAGKALVNVEGTTQFNRRPICYIPQLDDVQYDPIYFVDWSKLQPIVQDGYWMVESKPMMDRKQHTTVTVFVDGSHQNLCTNRRTAGFVIHKPIPAQ